MRLVPMHKGAYTDAPTNRHKREVMRRSSGLGRCGVGVGVGVGAVVRALRGVGKMCNGRLVGGSVVKPGQVRFVWQREMPPSRIELPTFRLLSGCSTTEL